MRRKLKYIILTIALIFLGFQTYAQMAQDGPPEPKMQSKQQNGSAPCGQLPENPGNSPRIPPPVGLCLPINDYLLPLLIVGIAFGGYKVWRIKIA